MLELLFLVLGSALVWAAILATTSMAIFWFIEDRSRAESLVGYWLMLYCGLTLLGLSRVL